MCGSLHAHQRQIREPGLRRHKALDLAAHGARVEVVHDEEPGRVVDQALMRGLLGSGGWGVTVGPILRPAGGSAP
jgi:hypothetical protein